MAKFDWSETIFEIGAYNDEELYSQLLDYSKEELREFQRILTAATNKKLYNRDYGKNVLTIDDEPANADWEHQVDIETEETHTIQWSVETNVALDYDEDTRLYLLPSQKAALDMLKVNSLDCCAKTPAPKAVASIPEHPWTALRITNSMENDMNYNTAVTAAPDFGFAETRKYLINRLSAVEGNKIGEAELKFLPQTETPKTGKELKAAIANGWLVADVKDDYTFGWNSPNQFLEFRDPAKPHDRDGFKAAVKAIEDGRRNTKDAIMVLPADGGLAALKAYEGTTFH